MLEFYLAQRIIANIGINYQNNTSYLTYYKDLVFNDNSRYPIWFGSLNGNQLLLSNLEDYIVVLFKLEQQLHGLVLDLNENKAEFYIEYNNSFIHENLHHSLNLCAFTEVIANKGLSWEAKLDSLSEDFVEKFLDFIEHTQGEN